MPTDTTARTEPAHQLHALLAEHIEWCSHEFSEWAMSRGDYRFADRLADCSLEAQDRRAATTEDFLRRLSALDRAQLSAEDQLNADLFAWNLRDTLAEHRFRTFLMPIGPMGGPHLSIAEMHEHVRFDTEEDYANYVKRLGHVPRCLEQHAAALRAGAAEGRTPPQVTLSGLAEQFVALLDHGQLNDLGRPFRARPERCGAAAWRALQQKFTNTALPAVRAAIARFRDCVLDEYVPRCRTTIAARDLPDGAAFYAHRLRSNTTTELTPDEVHQLGLHEVARIEREMVAVIKRTDFWTTYPETHALADADLRRVFTQHLRKNARFYHTTPADLVREYRDICKRIDGELPRLFRRLPRLPYGVREIPAAAAPRTTTAYYYPGDIRNAQAGLYYVNTYALDQRPRYEMLALSLHEAVPGHHLQIALAQELEGLPDFRREGFFNAYGEGWALYAERLGLEMGLYGDPYDDFGRLIFEIWRAARLVVDPGLHALGWSRQQALDYMQAHTALAPHNIEAEVDRYISWPGQATSYKIGELRIRGLRAEAEQRRGSRFDVREFHDVVLGAGALPLSILEQRVQAWLGAAAT